ncbi:protein of unknown function DUF58 [Beutenbergia cavernae DSM 12333]|uniref:DUF58 domain-containing protein n=1 Tax=Beutenbergia cavernae (strain ATCC BAA-8 / DSM 12333 / CCUG 43141 / JCM 11478 / NBRC 16432 / NCIMB 13614 / HKI 0122) TaxID=471853 RepID=C5C559_BEUC1|nr:DUF58 domain-containing protein [Beutenbergia cavernae]ACQ82199.1 protein of unknown function DUF58 [Beutenbergia cavernae DSM 12333]
MAAVPPSGGSARSSTAHSRLAQVRARLDLPTVRKAAGLLEGRHRSIYSGHGQDFDEMALYVPGDDVGDIDWKASASNGIPVIRRFQRESNLAMVLAVDTGRNMAALAPGGGTKADVVRFAADVIAYLARGRGDLLALVAGDDERIVQIPARGGTEHMEMLLRRIDAMLELAAPPSNIGHVLDRVLTWFSRRSLVVVITDEARPGLENELALKRLRTRHEVMIIQIADALPTDFGDEAVDDVDVPLDVPEFLRARKDLAAEARDLAERRRADVAAMLRRHGVQAVTVRTEEDLVNSLIRLLRRQKRAGR